MNSNLQAFNFLSLQKESAEDYKIIFFGKIILESKRSEYKIEIFLYPITSDFINGRYTESLIISRFIPAVYLSIFGIGFVFNRNNELLGIQKGGILIKEFKIESENFKYLDTPLYISTESFLNIHSLEQMGIFESSAKTSSLLELPCFSIINKEIVENTQTKNSVRFLIPVTTLLKYFMFPNLKITEALLDGSFRDDIGSISKIIEDSIIKKSTGFVKISDGYTKEENLVLAWLCLSERAFDAAGYIFNSINFENKKSKNHFIRTKFPFLKEVKLSVKGFYTDALKRTFFCEEIVSSENVFPVDKVEYSFISDHRSIKDESLKNELETKIYVKQFSTLPVNNDNSNASFVSEDTSVSSQKPIKPLINFKLKGFFSEHPIPVNKADKDSQEYNYSGKTTTLKIADKIFTTSKDKNINGTAIYINGLIAKETIEFSEQFQFDFINSILLPLKTKFTITKTSETFSKLFIVFEIYNEKQQSYFYLIEKKGASAFNRRIILIFSPILKMISNEQFYELLTNLNRIGYNWTNINDEIKKQDLLVRGFNRREKETQNEIYVDTAELADRIEKFILKPVDNDDKNLQRQTI